MDKKMSAWSLLVPAIVVLVGWFVGHWLNVQRDQANKKTELRVQYLIEAYRRLEYIADRPAIKIDGDKRHDVESAIADIQLFGSPDEIRLAIKWAGDVAGTGKGTVKDLLKELRRDLRKELQLEDVDEVIHYLRLHDRKEES